MLHHAPAGAFADIDHRVVHAAAHSHLGQFPVEQGLVERFGVVEVGGRLLHMYRRVSHGTLRLRLPFLTKR